MKVLVLLTIGLLAAPAARAADVSVTESNQKFDRDIVTLKQGDALVVMNADTGDHNLRVISEDGDPQDLGVQKPGNVVRMSFPTSGNYKIRCSITPDMRMRVVVN